MKRLLRLFTFQGGAIVVAFSHTAMGAESNALGNNDVAREPTARLWLWAMPISAASINLPSCVITRTAAWIPLADTSSKPGQRKNKGQMKKLIFVSSSGRECIGGDHSNE
jgi:hypothetical protein